MFFTLLGDDAHGYQLERIEFGARGKLVTTEGFRVRPGRDKYR